MSASDHAVFAGWGCYDLRHGEQRDTVSGGVHEVPGDEDEVSGWLHDVSGHVDALPVLHDAVSAELHALPLVRRVV